MSEEKSFGMRASRYKRLKDPPHVRLTERDKRVIKAVNDFRVLRQDQVQKLFFPSRNTAQVRLWLLWQHKFLKRDFLMVRGGIQVSPVLYVLDRRGADLLKSEYGYDNDTLRWSPRKNPSHQFLEHTLGIADIRIAANLSCRKHKKELITWLDEKVLKSDYDKVRVGNKWLPVIPDAYFIVRVPAGELHFFLEFDRGIEQLRTIERKMAAYLFYHRSGKCKARYGTDRIRVLTVTIGGKTGIGRKRLSNLKKKTEKVGGGQQFWFSTLDQVTSKDFLLSSIWRIAGSKEHSPLVSA